MCIIKLMMINQKFNLNKILSVKKKIYMSFSYNLKIYVNKSLFFLISNHI